MRKLVTVFLCMVLSILQINAQNRTITGKITDTDGKPVAGASVLLKGTTKGVSADEKGAYSISIPTTTKTLVVTGIGFTTREMSVGAGNVVNVTLVSSDKNLEEVVVTGYSTKKKAEFTGATSRVSSKQIEQIPIASFEQILQGRAPGLYIASGSGQPGSSARVNIRGVGSISGGNSPLYVLDGIPIEEGVFRTMNPNDFESVDVLKDAAGAGLYGSRGANGVIVITSKKGRQGKVQMGYRGLMGMSQPMQLSNLQMMNGQQRLEYEERLLGPVGLANGFPGWDYSPTNPRFQTLTPAQRANEARLLDSVRGINTFWPDIMTRNAKFRQHELNASGGANNLSFYTSLSVFNQEGIIHRSNLDRYTFRANIDYRTERLTVSVRSAAGWSSRADIESEAGVALANPVAAAYLELPYTRFRNDAGQVATGTGRTGANAYDRLFTTTNNTNQFKGTLGVTIQYNIWNGISFKTTNGVDWRNNNTNRFINPTSFAGSLVAQGAQGSYNEGNSENLQLISTTGFVFNKVFKTKHAVNASLMYEAIRNKSRSFSATGFGINAQLPNTPAGITPGSATNNLIPGVGGGKTINGLSSTFLVADYTYDKRFTVSGSLRRDAPSQVPLKNRDNIFWSAGASWNLIAEKFMEKQTIFQDARVRASYGETGNVNGFSSDFGYISTYGSTNYAGVPGIFPTSPGNEDYKLESQVLTNIGVDLTFWDRRARFTADYFIKDSRNLFVSQPLSRTTGFSSLATNAAQVRNSGLDFSLSFDVIRKKDLLVTFGINGGFLKNRVLSLGGLSEIPQGTSIIRVGYPLGSHFQVGWMGVDPQSGNPVYQDINGLPTNVFSAANNRAEFGTFIPSFTGGATMDITWKNFNISALLSTAQNVQRFNNEAFFYETTNSNTGFNKRVDMLNSWQKPGDITNYQRIGTARQFSSRDVQDASFIRFRNLQIGYNFVIKNEKLGIRGIRFWAQGQNLFTWTKWQGFDPEESNNIASYEFPNPRTYTMGLDINF
jgi:TonB-linked SusC/RagA family outer membrane protein